MRIPAREYERLPAHLKILFRHVDGSDEVLDAFAAFGHVGGNTGGDFTSGGNLYGMPNRPNGFNDTGTAARFFYSAKAGPDDRWGSRHPTVKPIDLITYLVKLICPPGGIFLDPFAGSGTAAVAALASARSAILIERDDTYVADIRARVAFYAGTGPHSVVAKNRNLAAPAGPLL